MLNDLTLSPKEAVRLAALGLLAEGERSYADLAGGVRHFTTRYWRSEEHTSELQSH